MRNSMIDAMLCATPLLLMMALAAAAFYPAGWKCLRPIVFCFMLLTLSVVVISFGQLLPAASDAPAWMASASIAAGVVFILLGIAVFFARHVLWKDAR